MMALNFLFLICLWLLPLQRSRWTAWLLLIKIDPYMYSSIILDKLYSTLPSSPPPMAGDHVIATFLLRKNSRSKIDKEVNFWTCHGWRWFSAAEAIFRFYRHSPVVPPFPAIKALHSHYIDSASCKQDCFSAGSVAAISRIRVTGYEDL